jgi:hypothetical protein
MDINVLSPEQISRLKTYDYTRVEQLPETDALKKANQELNEVWRTLNLDNQRLKKNVSTLQILADSIFLKPTMEAPEWKQEIKWDIYYYKKYTYQLHLLWVVIGTCILLNLALISPEYVGLFSGLILAVSFLYLSYRLWDYMYRDDTNFDEYNFYDYTGSYNRSDSIPTQVDISNCIIRPIPEKRL